VQLLVAILHREEVLDEILAVLVEHELPDAVVVESRTGLELLERDLPIFAGLRSLIPGGIDFSRLVLCVVGDREQARRALGAIRDLGSGAVPPGEPANAVFLVPLSDLEYF
jgi:nitrogen regulatory protein P-II 1